MQREEMQKTKVVKEFSRFAYQYDKYNIIQAKVAKYLVDKIPKDEYSNIIDIGCGSGEIYKNIIKNGYLFNHFIALDYSKNMLDIHPSNLNITKMEGDFNSLDTFDNLLLDENTIFVSSSALQWSSDLDFTISQISKKSQKSYLAIFTSNTFKTLHNVAKIKSPIYDVNFIKNIIEKYFNANFELKKYKLYFETTKEMLEYIKKSGVSGGEKQLSYKQIKNLIESYPLEYLEFEVLFIEATSL